MQFFKKKKITKVNSPLWCSSQPPRIPLCPAAGSTLWKHNRVIVVDYSVTVCDNWPVTWRVKSHSLNMASSLTKQQMKLSKSIISLSAYRATRIWFNLLLSLKPANTDSDSSKKLYRINSMELNWWVIKRATCSLHGQAHLIRAHRPRLVKIKLSKNDLRNTEEKY